MSFWEKQYSSLASDEEFAHRNLQTSHPEESSQPHAHISIRSRVFCSITYLIGLFLLLFAVFAIATTFTTQSSTHPAWSSNCGCSPSEARARGCRFDIMSFSWLPQECYDGELVEDFRKVRNWQYFTSSNHSDEVSEAEATRGERNLHVRWEHHLHHCAFMWRKLHRAVARGGPVDGYVGNYHHTIHCGSMLVDEHRLYDLEDLNTIIMVKYPECSGRLGSSDYDGVGVDVF